MKHNELKCIAAICAVMITSLAYFNTSNAKTVAVELQSGERLSERLGAGAYEIDSLTVTGQMNKADFDCLWYMALKGKLAHLDMRDAVPDPLCIPDSAFNHFGDKNYDFKGVENVTRLPYFKSVILPRTTQWVGAGAFAHTLLESIEFPPSLASIVRYAFYDTPNLRKVTFSEGIQVIWEYAFAKSNIVYLVFPKSLSHVFQGSFADCSNLKSIYVLKEKSFIIINPNINGAHRLNSRTTPYDHPRWEHFAFHGTTPHNIPVYVPQGSLHEFTKGGYNVEGWEWFTDIRELAEMPALDGTGVEAGLEETIAGRDISIASRNGAIEITSACGEMAYEIYSISGCKMASGRTSGGISSIPLAKGIYIVRAGEKRCKLAI